MNFNDFTRARTAEEQQLVDMLHALETMDRSTPEFKLMIKRIESLQYKLHRARITPIALANTPTTHTTTTQGAPMTKPVFSDDLVIRQLQYKDCLVQSGDYTKEEVALMAMPELRAAVDELFPMAITVRTALPSGGTSTHYVTKKAA
jgi:hypothetical protein